MNYTYSNPGTWGTISGEYGQPIDTVASQGDIFLVNSTDAARNDNLTAGSFYRAQFDGVTIIRPYPASGASDINWQYAPIAEDSSDWFNVDYFSMRTASSCIYNNGLHMVAISIDITATNRNSDRITVPEEVLKNNISLIDYDTGIALHRLNAEEGEGPFNDKQSPPGWTYSDKPNIFTEYNQLLGSDVEALQTITFYVALNSSAPTGQQKILGASIKPTGNNTAVISNSKNGLFHSPAPLVAKQRIVYTTNNISVTQLASTDSSYTNYYISSALQGTAFIKSVIHGPLMNLYDPEKPGGLVANKCYFWGNLRCIYMWDIDDPEKTKESLGWGPYVTAKINNIPGAFTITRTWQTEKVWNKNSQAGWECFFTLYDQFGNSGTFKNHGSTGLWGVDDIPTDSYWYDVHIDSSI